LAAPSCLLTRHERALLTKFWLLFEMRKGEDK